MKTKILLFFLCLTSLNMMGQGVVTRKKQQPTTQQTHKPAQKQKPAQTVKMCDICEKPLSKCDYGGKHPYCQTCGKLKERCQYKGNHPSTASQSNTSSPSVNSSEASVSQPTGYISGHGYVDLGLSVKWATSNVGASSPSDYGGYYAWGETNTKSNYDWDTCFDCLDNNGYSWRTYKQGGQRKITPLSGHDAARENWGGSWRMPTDVENEELCNRCTWTWTTVDGHDGCKVTGPNGRSIFLPAAGYRFRTNTYFKGVQGCYWSVILESNKSASARYLKFDYDSSNTKTDIRLNGFSVRPVTE